MAIAIAIGLAVATTGAQAATIYVSTQGNDTADGTTAGHAVATLTRGLALATGGGTLRVSSGRFTGAMLAPPENVTIEGGWDTKFTQQTLLTSKQIEVLKASDDPCATKTVTCIGADADRVMTIRNKGVSLSQLVIIGPDRSKTTASSSYGLVVDGVPATLKFVVIKAGVAGNGADGETGQTGQGFCSAGGGGGWAESKDGNDVCAQHNGSQGQSLTLNGRTANGGGGGGSGNSNCSMWPSANNVSDGNAGGTGDAGIEGSPAAAAASGNGTFSRRGQDLQWISPASAPHGGTGSAGGGGGGGGPGGSWNIVGWCLVGYPAMGGSGHAGNRGGCGGNGGESGGFGGGAFAMVINAAKVSVQDVALLGGTGGRGGKGGEGNVGAAGEVNAASGQGGQSRTLCGTNDSSAGRGGSGGSGGTGGGGGGGAGGNGGPAITLVRLGTAEIVEAGGVFRTAGGAAGSSGTGGGGANSKTVAPSGNEGVHASDLTLTLN
ncbi:hypothetical protein QLQ15_13420 [Lysobacter sp. LF1]|uniref:DUF1565 domain-containing protein n=1 Tax=Lysobacter stagni TaxID=3045172 RepID=A0ABT6XID4_9GAMM|nr:hypothetical protein [Lysobacter sp. LF1]MDI9239906.1 hypothetical protein [Lysobacter sp. LF1]